MSKKSEVRDSNGRVVGYDRSYSEAGHTDRFDSNGSPVDRTYHASGNCYEVTSYDVFGSPVFGDQKH